MTPILIAAVGAVAVIGGALLLRSLGPRYRIGRLLAVTTAISVADAIEIAATRPGSYVRVDGRVDAEQEFEDADHRPLVFRRTRVEVRRRNRWERIENGRESVPFEIREGLSGITVDDTMLGDGLVVVERESTGTARDVPDRVPSDIGGDAAVRIRIAQLSSVDHVSALGVAQLDGAGRPRLTAGGGRPLIVTNLEPAEAMRILVADRRYVPIAATIALAAGIVLVLLGVLLEVLSSLVGAP